MVKTEPSAEGRSDGEKGNPKHLKPIAVKGGMGDGRPPATPQHAVSPIPKPCFSLAPPPKAATALPPSEEPTAKPMAPSAAGGTSRLCKVEGTTSVKPSMSKRVQELKQRLQVPSQSPSFVKPSTKAEVAPAKPTMKAEVAREAVPVPTLASLPASGGAGATGGGGEPATVPTPAGTLESPEAGQGSAVAAPGAAAALPERAQVEKDAWTARLIAAEESIRARLEKMDEEESVRAVASAKQHPWFADYEQWRRQEVFGISASDPDLPEFGVDDIDEELISWEIWLWEQQQVRPPIQAKPKVADAQPKAVTLMPVVPALPPTPVPPVVAPPPPVSIPSEVSTGHVQEPAEPLAPADGGNVGVKKKMQQFGTTLAALNKISKGKDGTMSGGAPAPKPAPPTQPPLKLISMPPAKPVLPPSPAVVSKPPLSTGSIEVAAPATLS